MHLSPVVGKMTKCKALIGWYKTVLLSQALSNVSNVVRSLWLGYIILLTPWQPSETLLVLCDWYHSIQSSGTDHTTWRMNIFCLHLQFFSSASKVKSRLKVYKTQHLHVHGLLPCYKTCSESRKLLTDPLRCKFQVNWSCSDAPVSAAYCSASEWQGQKTAACDISEGRDERPPTIAVLATIFIMRVTNMLFCSWTSLLMHTGSSIYIDAK